MREVERHPHPTLPHLDIVTFKVPGKPIPVVRIEQARPIQTDHDKQ